jgi:septum formation protein
VRLYLASTSPARLATLRAAGIEPLLLDSQVDEDAAVAAAEARGEGSLPGGKLSGPELVLLLARAKAEAVVGRLVDAFELDGVISGKPHLPEVAKQRWLLQRGREGVLHSGHWIIDARADADPGQDGAAAGVGSVSSTTVVFADNITDEEIDAYVATGEPLKVAGAFTIDSLGAPFISEVRGDPHAVVGLSLAQLRELLLTRGISWPSLWNRRS